MVGNRDLALPRLRATLGDAGRPKGAPGITRALCVRPGAIVGTAVIHYFLLIPFSRLSQPIMCCF